VADHLFVDVRRFAAPPGRPYGGERFERRPRRGWARAFMRRWGERWRGADPDPALLLPYLDEGAARRPPVVGRLS